MTTDRTIATFETDASIAGAIDEESFHGAGVHLLEELRRRLRDSGWRCSIVEDHEFYGIRFTVETDADRSRVLLQYPGPWLLSVSAKPSIWQRLTGSLDDRADQDLVTAVDRSLTAMGVRSGRWFDRDSYEQQSAGPVIK
jgi:hypothetical protein